MSCMCVDSEGMQYFYEADDSEWPDRRISINQLSLTLTEILSTAPAVVVVMWNAAESRHSNWSPPDSVSSHTLYHKVSERPHKTNNSLDPSGQNEPEFPPSLINQWYPPAPASVL